MAAAFRRRAERRPAVESSLQTPAGPLLTGIRRPLRRVLDRLAGDSAGIARAWRTLLRRLKLGPGEYDALVAMDLAACYRQLSLGPLAGAVSGEEGYRVAIEAGTRTLMASGVSEDHATAAVALYLDACLGYLDRPAEARALARLTSATQRLVTGDYGEERVAGLRRLDDRERQKLSGDLHDEVGADLVVLKLYVEMIAAELAKGCVAPVGPKLEEALALIAHAIESVRRLTLDLGPAFLDARGFLPALRGFVRQFAHRTGIKVELEEAGAPVSLPASYETALYRVLRGALSNVAKHSKARHVSVTLRRLASVYVMTVEDDGSGFEVGAQDRSVGLTVMRERIRGLRGRLTIESWSAGRRGQKSGTRVEARLPLRKKAAS